MTAFLLIRLSFIRDVDAQIGCFDAEPPRDMTDEDEDLIGSGKAVELVEVWQGLFQGTRLVKAGE